MLDKLRRKFTKWYVRKGYRFEYNFNGYESWNIPTAYWICPNWIKPLLVLFSPSIYQLETDGKALMQGFIDGFNSALK